MVRGLIVGLGLVFLGCAGSTDSEEPSPSENSENILRGGKADAWDWINDPARFQRFLDEDLEYVLDELPLQGTADKQAWPGSYWPTYQDSTNYRWEAGELSPLEKYDMVFNGWVPPPGFDELRPIGSGCRDSDEYDEAYYEALGPAARWMSENRGNWRTHDGIDNDEDGEIDECSDREGIATWWGLCHAWTPAALIEEEPIEPVIIDGVTFYPSDLKALMLTVYDSSNAVVIGGRCKTRQVERDENGRIKDLNCRDTNAGTFHIIMANLLGRFKTGFAEDRTYNAQVWNQPVHSYHVTEMTDVDEATAIALLVIEPESVESYPFNEDAVRWSEVKVSVRYVAESMQSKQPMLPNFSSYLRTDRYHYLLEIDADGRIIGGEWINGMRANSVGGVSQRPDFLWYPSGPRSNPIPEGPRGIRNVLKNPHVGYLDVVRLFERSRLNAPTQPAD
jgi:hypothetical protein